jgi:hypothetical protein
MPTLRPRPARPASVQRRPSRLSRCAHALAALEPHLSARRHAEHKDELAGLPREEDPAGHKGEPPVRPGRPGSAAKPPLAPLTKSL